MSVRHDDKPGGALPLRHCWRCAMPISRPPTVCGKCGQDHYANPKPASEAVAVGEGKVLLIQRDIQPWLNHWDIPGGFCEAGEHPEDAAKRELLEETGIPGEVLRPLGIWMDQYGDPYPDGLIETTMNISYLVRPLSMTPVREIDGEAKLIRWFDWHALPDELAFPDHARAVLSTAASLSPGTV